MKLIKDCQHLEQATKSEFILFSKRDLVELGECIGINFLKNKVDIDLVTSCKEVSEDRRNPLGILSLSKVEAVQIGQCVGVINFIYQHYHGEKVFNERIKKYSNREYRCKRGNEAVVIISTADKVNWDRNIVKNLLCVG